MSRYPDPYDPYSRTREWERQLDREFARSFAESKAKPVKYRVYTTDAVYDTPDNQAIVVSYSVENGVFIGKMEDNTHIYLSVGRYASITTEKVVDEVPAAE